MNFSLVICTYMRPDALLKLLYSVKSQLLYPNEILIIDGSTNDETKLVLQVNHFDNLFYFKVNQENRGLTRQRNFGISKVATSSEVVCFLDDDTVLETLYFERLMATYELHPEALGVCGFITNEVKWEKVSIGYQPATDEFVYDEYKRKESKRFIVRKKLGLDSAEKPGYMPEYSNGRGVGYLPPSGRIYQVEQLKGGVSSFRKEVFNTITFSTYFDGYGLYEDADFTFRVSKVGKLFVNTSARLAHYHDQSGRPDKYKFGKMVVKNGWHVWRTKFPSPSLKARIKWNLIVLLLSFLLLKSVFSKPNKMDTIKEFFGRISAWISVALKF